MAGIQQLKKRLKSVNTTSQIADAMKTVSSTKFSKLSVQNRLNMNYDETLSKILEFCGEDFAGSMPAVCADAPPCYIVLGSNRGLCGNYNADLNSFAQQVTDSQNAFVILCGKATITYFNDKNIHYNESGIFPDTPKFEDYRKLFEMTKAKYEEGEISSVNIIYSKYVNTLVQTPFVRCVLPIEKSFESNAQKFMPHSFIFEPDKQTVCKALISKMIDCEFYACVIEAATGCQAATLMAMRTASDNATDAALNLTMQINKKRQSEVTAGVIETTSDMIREEAE